MHQFVHLKRSRITFVYVYDNNMDTISFMNFPSLIYSFDLPGYFKELMIVIELMKSTS